MTSLIIAVFLASIVGSPHCACMCGPLIAFTMGMEGISSGARKRQVILYHGGRLLAYLSLGILAFWIGIALDQMGILLGVQRCSAFLSALVLMGFGFHSISRVYGKGILALRIPANLHRLISLVHTRALALRPGKRALVVGVLTAVLPCGWLYVFVTIAAGIGDFFLGLTIMLAFWVGTLPVLTICTFGIQRIVSRLSPKIRLVPAILMILLGMFTVSSRLSLEQKNQMSMHENVSRSGMNVSSFLNELFAVKPGCDHHDH